MQKKLNLKIKYREGFRPFAPSVLAEDAREYFDLQADSPYMLVVAPVKESRRLKLPDNYNDLPLWNNVTLSNQPLTIVEIFSKYDLPLRLQGRICVPFLSKTATWSSDENSLYITMYPPPPVEENGATLLVRFGEGMEACFDSLGEYENNSVGNEVGKDTIDHQEEGSD